MKIDIENENKPSNLNRTVKRYEKKLSKKCYRVFIVLSKSGDKYMMARFGKKNEDYTIVTLFYFNTKIYRWITSH